MGANSRLGAYSNKYGNASYSRGSKFLYVICTFLYYNLITITGFYLNLKQELSRPPSSYNTLEEVKGEHPEVLFYKVPREVGSVYFYFKSYLKDKQRILGFDNYGNALDPTQVQPGQEESLFQMM